MRAPRAQRRPKPALLRRRSDLRGRFLAGGIDGEDSVETRDLEDLRDVAVAADERKLSVVRAEALHAADEDSERRRVDDHVLAALPDHFEQLLLELGGGVEIDLAGERDDVGVLTHLFRLDVEIHRMSPRFVWAGVYPDYPVETLGCFFSSFSLVLMAGATGSSGASFRKRLYAAMAVLVSDACSAAWASANWTLGSFGLAAATSR